MDGKYNLKKDPKLNINFLSGTKEIKGENHAGGGENKPGGANGGEGNKPGGGGSNGVPPPPPPRPPKPKPLPGVN